MIQLIMYQLICHTNHVLQSTSKFIPSFLDLLKTKPLYGWIGPVARIFTPVHTTVYEVEKTAAKTVNSFVLVDN